MPKKNQWFNDVFLPSLFEYAKKTVGLCKNCKISDRQFDICCRNMEEVKCYDADYRKNYIYYRCTWNDREIIVTRYKNNYISFSLNSVETVRVKQEKEAKREAERLEKLDRIKQNPERLEKSIARKLAKLEKLKDELSEAIKDEEEDVDIINIIKDDIIKLQNDIYYLLK